MYIAYYDESGDDGYPRYSSELFVLTVSYFHHNLWKDIYLEIHDFRKRLNLKYGFPVKLEMHARGFLLNKKPYRNFKWSDEERVSIVGEFCDLISRLRLKIINGVINKTSITSANYPVLENALKFSVQRIENDLKKNEPDKKFMVITDQGRVGKMRKTTRKIQRINFIPSMYGPYNYRQEIELLIEDPLEKNSKESFFIQISDLVAFIIFLYMHYELGVGKSHNRLPVIINKIKIMDWVNSLIPSLNTEASQQNEYGIVIYPR